MLNNKTIAVVVPSYNEETQIEMVIKGMPSFVDRIIVVNDHSTDQTSQVVEKLIKEDETPLTPLAQKESLTSSIYNRADEIVAAMNQQEIEFFVPSQIANQTPDKDRIILINMLKNSGVGGAIARGYKWCKDNNVDCTAVMAGDGQMDPAELESICNPVVYDEVDYVKGNRLHHPSAKHIIPKSRYFGNSVLTIMTKVASGYWQVSDTQTGYTALSKHAINLIELPKIYPSYGVPNDILTKLNIANCTIKEIIIKPVYKVGEASKMKIPKVIPKISLLLLRCFFERLWKKYFLQNFHPLFLFYHLAFLLALVDVSLIFHILGNFFQEGKVTSPQYLLMTSFFSISALQALFFAMWMDIQDNERLNK